MYQIKVPKKLYKIHMDVAGAGGAVDFLAIYNNMTIIRRSYYQNRWSHTNQSSSQWNFTCKISLVLSYGPLVHVHHFAFLMFYLQ
jgi:hypothetical protein